MPVCVAEPTEAPSPHAWPPSIPPMEPPGGAAYHEPALIESVVTFLAPRPGTVIADATCGTGGHSLALLPHLAPHGRLIAIDRDAEALAIARQRLWASGTQVLFRQDNFRHLPEILQQLAIPYLDGLLLDLGLSSVQVDCAKRGFSFLKDGPLDMRMDPQQAMTAAALIRERSEDDLAHLLKTLGEERYARRIARRIVSERRTQPMTTTTQLARLVARAVPRRSARTRLHPATRTFQALRIAVNDELGALEALLGALPGLLAPKGRAVILAFHSLEDRLVKQAFARGHQEGIWTTLTKHVVRPSRDEIARNPRVRSVRLRAVEKR